MRCFFGLEAKAPWPASFPNGRIVDESSRHLTLAFLGNTENIPDCDKLPKPQFKIGKVAKTTELLFLSNVVACNVEFFGECDAIKTYQTELLAALSLETKKDFLPHVTIARAPKDKSAWTLEPMPLLFGPLHLYESMGDLTYKPIWTHEIIWPFEEIPHTADIAFLVRGENLSELCFHAQIALAFAYPELLPYANEVQTNSFEEIVVALNKIVTGADLDFGSPIKAVSFSGDAHEIDGGLLQWEMIIDI